MTVRKIRLIGAVAIIVLVICAGFAPQAIAQDMADPSVAELGDQFRSDIAQVNGVRLHYVRGGAGPAVVLVHGFPQNWHAFRPIITRLAKSFTVISIDMRGVGRSSLITQGYDAATIAGDIRQLAHHLDLGPIYVVGHDNGGMVAYQSARLYPDDTRGVMILDVPLPGIEPWNQIKADPALWHFGFHQTPQLPEQLIARRESLYFRAFFDRFALNREAISDADVAHYVAAHTGTERLARLIHERDCAVTAQRSGAAG